jgi:hypothetical protein
MEEIIMEEQAQTAPAPSQGRTNEPRPVVKVQYANEEEVRPTITLVLNTGLDSPQRRAIAGQGFGARALAELEMTSRVGAADNFAATLLALRGIPRFSPSGEDNVIETSARYMNDALTVPAGVRVAQSCLLNTDASMDGCRIAPVTLAEQRIVLVPDDSRPATPNMVPNRTIPISRSTAFTAGFTDALVNPQRYQPANPDGTSQNLTPAQNATHVREAVAAENPGAAADTVLRSTAIQCLENNPAVEIRQCAIAGARSGVVFSGDNPEVQARYASPPALSAAPARHQ